MAVTVEDLKQHLRIDPDYEDEDEYLFGLLDSAVDYIFDITGRANDDTQPARYNHAVKLLVGHWFQNREAVSELNLKSIPWGLSHLIHSLRLPGSFI